MHIDEENLVIMLHGNYQYLCWFINIYLIILPARRFLVFLERGGNPPLF